MLTLKKTDSAEIASVAINDDSVDNLLSTEWLLTNNRGGYASSTILGCNTRRYHGLLIGSLHPPIDKIMALAGCLEMVISDGKVFDLSAFEFNDKFAPRNLDCIKRFRQDIGVHFDYQLDGLEVTKSVYLLHDADVAAVIYEFSAVQKPAELVLRPFVGLRDFHSLQKSFAPLYSQWRSDGLLIRHNVEGSCELLLNCPAAGFEEDRQWWFDFVYRRDRERGQDYTEDLWTPGVFKCSIDSPTDVVLWAALRPAGSNEQADRKFDIHRSIAKLRSRQKSIIDKSLSIKKKHSPIETTLTLAADAFIVTRDASHEPRATILAGFPWFADWGRDTFISLPGLLLATGRFEEAKSVLTGFAQHAQDGLIPNRFDDRSNTAHFNSIDASLWFINAAFQYLDASGDTTTFAQQLLHTIRWIIDSYQQGSRFGICADTDGLITGGSKQTQLTWMDAKFADHSFTPRYGKAVEVNALWYNALCLVAGFYTDRDIKSAGHYRSMVDIVEDSFRRLFWSESKGYLNDCILPDGSVDSTLRPNQIFAVSLPFSPLSSQQQKSVVDVVQKYLLTPYGLRTLSPDDSRYEGRYIGPSAQRDRAYHQGTVWPYLMGAFVEGFLKVNGSSDESKARAAEFIQPLLRHLTDNGCLGRVSEIFDGDHPHNPRGCFAQAWSVAELLRAYKMTETT